MSSCQGDGPGAIPGSRNNFLAGCASARGRVPKTQLTPGSTEAACHSHFGVVADKQCTCPASRLMRARYPPTPPFSESLCRSTAIPIAIFDGGQNVLWHFNAQFAHQ